MKKIVLVQLVLFALAAVIVVPYGIYYIVGPRGIGDRMTLSAEVDDALGVSEGTVVTYRGVQVGAVSAVNVEPQSGGARLEFELESGTEIPVDSIAKITQGTLAGMLNVDIFPRVDRGPYLVDGDSIEMPAEEQPVQIAETLASAASMLDTFEPGTVATVGTELGAAFQGLGPDLARLITDADDLSGRLEAQSSDLTELLSRTTGLTSTMAGNSDRFVDGVAAAHTIADTLSANEDRITEMMTTTPDAMRRADGVLAANEMSFAAVLSNLVDVAPVISDRSAALQTGLVSIPAGLAALESIVHGDRADFALIATQGPVCAYDTPRRQLGDESPVTPDLTHYCPPGQDHGQRGAQNAPRPDDLGVANRTTPGTLIGPPVVADPILIPAGEELATFWRMLLQGIGSGGN